MPDPNIKSSADLTPSADLAPHFESVDGRPVFYVDGWPFTVLTVEIPWVDLIYGRYHETMHAYDYLYPAAKALGLNALKVPIKWSMVEPEKGKYDFTYLDHVKRMAEKNGLRLVLGWFGHYASGDGNIYINMTGQVFAPMYVIEDDHTYPRAVDADGVVHHNAASYDYPPIIEAELAAFRAFMQHIKETDAQTRTILMVQVENEIAVFGHDRRNRKRWRDHSPASNERYARMGFTDDLRYSAWRLSSAWIKPLTDAGTDIYPLPFFCNFVPGNKMLDWMVGGAPGEDVATYLENCPNLAFVGLNHYLPAECSVNDMRAGLDEYRVGRNISAITEANSDTSAVGPRLAYIAVGEYGAALYAPWALNVSYPTLHSPYVQEDGTIANGGPALRDCYLSLGKALPQVSYYGGSKALKVFMSRAPGEAFSIVEDVNGAKVTVTGHDNGQAIVIHPQPNEFWIVGYRCEVTIATEMARWPALRQIHVEAGFWDKNLWQPGGACWNGIDQSAQTISLFFTPPQAIRVYW